MLADPVARELFAAIEQLPIIDSHSHVDPLAPTAKSLDDLLGYHYYTELAHSAGMSRDQLTATVDPRERCRLILGYIDRFDNTAQYSWLVDISRTFLGFEGDHLSVDDCDDLFDASIRLMGAPDWTAKVIVKTRLERIVLTNPFDDSLQGFDAGFFVPCLRADDLVFELHKEEVRERFAAATGIEPTDLAAVRLGIGKLFERFKSAGAAACAISLPPSFWPAAVIGNRADDDRELSGSYRAKMRDSAVGAKIFWMLAEACRDFGLPFDLMIGVNRAVYLGGVFQGQDLFDQRTSLIQYADLFNAFPQVQFPVSVLTSAQNQELVSYSWIFPNVLPHGHWWYSNIPAYIESDLRARLSAVPKTKLLGYYSDAYKLEFVLPKFNMYKRVLAKVLAEDFVKPGRLTDAAAVELAATLLRGNVERVFGLA